MIFAIFVKKLFFYIKIFNKPGSVVVIDVVSGGVVVDGVVVGDPLDPGFGTGVVDWLFVVCLFVVVVC